MLQFKNSQVKLPTEVTQ